MININKAFRISSYSQSGYNFMNFTVCNHFNQFNEQKLEIEFQGGTKDSNLKEMENYWYGIKFIVKSRYSADLIFGGKLAEKLNVKSDIQPYELVEKLEKLGYQWVSYHNGLNGFQPVKKWPKGVTYTTFSHDNKLYKRVVAKDEKEAIKKLLKLCSKDIENGYDTEKWGIWLNNKHVYKVAEEELPIVPDLKSIPA